MRAFLILCVAAFTLMTFYSALWFKSEEIEADITTRVTDELNTTGAKDVAIDVDGRHVTLSGVVYDEATETAYLDTADKTYGALGPIDGLTYLAGGGFVKAVKDDSGITLNGAVSSEEARDALVAAATDATDGTVTDNLSIGGAAGDWEAEAGFGVAKLADLSGGALAVSPGTYTLSGLAKADGAAVQTELAERAGWQAFVTTPGVEAGLAEEVDRLKADTSELDQRILALMGERDSLDSSVGGLTTERDALTASLAAVNMDYNAAKQERDTAQEELDKLRASLTDNQSTAASLASDLDASAAIIAERDTTIEGLNGRVVALEGQNTDLAAELDAQKNALNADQQEVASLKTKIGVQTATITGLTGDLDAQKAASDADQQEIASLQSKVGVQSATITGLTADMDAQKAASDADQQEIASLQSKVGVQSATITGLTADLDAKTDELEALQGNVSNLGADGEAANAKIAELTSDLAELDGQNTDLTGQVATLEGEVGTLKGQLADKETSGAAALAKIAALTATATDQGKQVDDLSAVVAQRDDQVATLQDEVGTLNGQLTDQGKKVSDLTAVVAARDATIADLRKAKPAAVSTNAPVDTAAQCSASAGAVLENAQINFATGTANIAGASVPALERLTGIALACSESGLNVEVGGHTDSQGSDADNQALSERRAAAIVAFMTDRGVPAGTLDAVGYGEARPIADNATRAGRAQNRRISFEWQAR